MRNKLRRQVKNHKNVHCLCERNNVLLNHEAQDLLLSLFYSELNTFYNDNNKFLW